MSSEPDRGAGNVGGAQTQGNRGVGRSALIAGVLKAQGIGAQAGDQGRGVGGPQP